MSAHGTSPPNTAGFRITANHPARRKKRIPSGSSVAAGSPGHPFASWAQQPGRQERDLTTLCGLASGHISRDLILFALLACPVG